MIITQLPKRAFGKLPVDDFCFLQTQDIRRMIAQETFDNLNAKTNGVDVPRSDAECGRHGIRLSGPSGRGKRFADTKSKAPIPGAIGMGAELAFVTLISKDGKSAAGQQGETA